MGCSLIVEPGVQIRGALDALLDVVVASLAPEGDSSWCRLERSGAYMQALCGYNGFQVEMREWPLNDESDYDHWRARLPGGRGEPFALQQPHHAEPGFESELLSLELACTLLQGFLAGEARPDAASWRRM